MKKEKTNKLVNFAMRPSLYNKFSEICEEEQKTVSVVLRELILKRITEEESK